MHARFQDAMTVCAKTGKPDCFVTVTSNPNWKEIQEQLLPAQKAEDRPDLIARIFKLKLQALEEELYKNGIFGRRIANLRVIEFQKRGLPHTHILIILHPHDNLKSSEQVDEMVSAEIPPHPEAITDPDPERQRVKRKQAKRSRDLVLKHMVHGPCGKEKPNAPCMYNNKGEGTDVFHKSFPKQFMCDTLWDKEMSYACYRRRTPQQGGSDACHNNRVLGNRWIVPYSPYLLLRYNCHINVEICVSSKATKYLYKYVHRGDRAMMRVDDGQPQERNEIREFQDMRSFGAAEACWKYLNSK